MTDEMFNRSSFLAQALRQDNQHVTNNTTDIYRLPSYDASQESGSSSTFYTANQNNSDQTLSPAYIHLFPKSELSDWKVENAGVSALSLTEESTRGDGINDRNSHESCEADSTRGNSSNDRRSHEIYEPDSDETATDRIRRKLIETGQLERLNEFVQRRLSEVGWTLDMTAYCRGIVKNTGSSITFEKLYEELRTCAKEKIPSELTVEVIQKIKSCKESKNQTDADVTV